MGSFTTAISVQIDKKDKELATNILNSLGLNMSTYINMAIKQLINKDGVPFEVVNKKPNKELLKALKEGQDILDGKKDAKIPHAERRKGTKLQSEADRRPRFPCKDGKRDRETSGHFVRGKPAAPAIRK